MPDQQNLEYEYRKQRYETYTKERDALRKDSLEVSGRYDKAILALAGGALALSITFLEKIAPHPVAWTFLVLGVAWLCLIASVLLELYALAASQAVTHQLMLVADEEYRQYLLSLPEHPQIPLPLTTAESPEVIENGRRRTRSFNNWSRWLLSIGIVLLCAFSLLNLPYSIGEKKTMADQPTYFSKGSYVAPSNALPPPPPPATPQVAPTVQAAPAQSAAAPTQSATTAASPSR